ncbi:MAG: prohibitin family protein [Ruminococcus sp.]|jgi:regulator of protease activity HflC (stomatin/prohibitin superfamily)|nr:prohibitin family protein [Ruminococcus sp.]
MGIIGIIIIAVTIVLALALNKVQQRKARTIVCGILGGLGVIVFLAGTLRIVDTTQIGVEKQFGKVKKYHTSGLAVINPIGGEMIKFDKTTRQLLLDIVSYSKDAQAMTAKVTVQYNVRQTESLEIASEFGTLEALESRVAKTVEEKAKVVLSHDSAMTILETRETLSPRFFEALETFGDRYHIDITSAIINDIDFSDVFENSVEAKMIAEQEKLKAEYDKEKALVVASQDKATRETKAAADLEVAKLEAQAAIEKAKGEADALQRVATIWNGLDQSTKDAILREEYYEKWDGILPKVSGSDGLILDSSVIS